MNLTFVRIFSRGRVDVDPDMMAQHRIGWIGTYNVQDGSVGTCHIWTYAEYKVHPFFNSRRSGDLDHKYSKDTTRYNSGRKVVQYNRNHIGQTWMPAKTGLSESPINGQAPSVTPSNRLQVLRAFKCVHS
ncbi:hypothetical protein QCA50_008277 [Cerrena zonata]|uniref:Uncharacterized protein n=1 Tax=Cerrena zonata TaxID=2478898 RepID=A0AAW0G606_9APHY